MTQPCSFAPIVRMLACKIVTSWIKTLCMYETRIDWPSNHATKQLQKSWCLNLESFCQLEHYILVSCSWHNNEALQHYVYTDTVNNCLAFCTKLSQYPLVRQNAIVFSCSLCPIPLQICNVLQSLDVFLAEVEPSVDSVTGSEDDWEQIRQIISVFNKVFWVHMLCQWTQFVCCNVIKHVTL